MLTWDGGRIADRVTVAAVLLIGMVAGILVATGITRAVVGRWLGVNGVAAALPFIGSIMVARAHASRARRFAVVIATLAAGYVGFAAVAAVELYWNGGPTGFVRYGIYDVFPGAPADGRLEAGDVVLAVGDKAVFASTPDGRPMSLAEEIQSAGESVALTVARGRVRRVVEMTPARDPATGRRILGAILIHDVELAPVDIEDAIAGGLRTPLHQAAATARLLHELILLPDTSVGIAWDPPASSWRRRMWALFLAGTTWLTLAGFDVLALALIAVLRRDRAPVTLR